MKVKLRSSSLWSANFPIICIFSRAPPSAQEDWHAFVCSLVSTSDQMSVNDGILAEEPLMASAGICNQTPHTHTSLPYVIKRKSACCDDLCYSAACSLNSSKFQAPLIFHPFSSRQDPDKPQQLASEQRRVHQNVTSDLFFFQYRSGMF